MKGFLEFIRSQGVVGLAIGFLLGGAISGLAKSLVDDIINPLLGVVIGNVGDLSLLSVKIGESEIRYGNFLNLFINMLIIAAVVYFVFKGLKLDKIDLKK